MEKAYNPVEIEQKWYKTWQDLSLFTPKAADNKYCIVLPPPNVTGSLHMGHAFQDTIMDTLIRYQRMQGKQTLWQPGTDHAGIATQMVVERQLQADGKSRHDLGREAFVEKIWEWKEQSGNTIYSQMQRLGASCDWSRSRFTMDKENCDAVTEAFVKLHDEGLIYRGKRLVNWDPILQTAVSDLEVLASEENSKLWHISYKLENSEKTITIATTRPETLFGDTAIAVNPSDPRYKDLIGEKVIVPVANRAIKIIADDYADPEFGSGAVKITPAHDFNDWEVGQRNNLEVLNILTEEAKLNENVPSKYQGLSCAAARGEIVKELEEIGALVKTEEHTLKVPRGDRTGAVIEPYLTYQWFVKVDNMAKEALEVVENGQIKFVPQNWENTYFNWMREIKDWCISRQLWWGHRIPAWYDNEGNIYVARNEQELRTKYNLSENINLVQDHDVLDTWFSSALWPFATMGWPQDTSEMQDYFPGNVLVTGFDIIFFWVARMIMFSLKFTNKIPFNTVYVHGLIQDQEGQKMSKSKGNVIDPIDLIDGISLDNLIAKRTKGLMQPAMQEKIIKQTKNHFPEGMMAYGTDALRFTFCSLATQNRHLRFSLKRIEGYRNFCNKLWNAARYVLMSHEQLNLDKTYVKDFNSYNKINMWITSLSEDLKETVARHFDNYRFDLAANAIYDFAWNEYCDWYLELSKPMLKSEDKELAHTTLYILTKVLRDLMITIHPIMPFISEEIALMLNNLLDGNDKGISCGPYVVKDSKKVNEKAVTQINWLKSFINTIRNIRGEASISAAKPVNLFICNASKNDLEILTDVKDLVKTLAKAQEIDVLDTLPLEPCATGLVGEMKVLIPLKGLIDVQAESVRLSKTIEKLSKDLEKTQKKLNNDSYINKAPAQVVAKEKEKAEQFSKSIEEYKQQLEKLKELK